MTRFGRTQHATREAAMLEAQAWSDLHDTSCDVWELDGWYTACVLPRAFIQPDPALAGWRVRATTAPRLWHRLHWQIVTETR